MGNWSIWAINSFSNSQNPFIGKGLFMNMLQNIKAKYLAYSLGFLSFLTSNFAFADVDTAPTAASGFVGYLTSLAAEFGPVKTAIVTIMGILILVLGIIQLGGFVAGVMKKMLG